MINKVINNERADETIKIAKKYEMNKMIFDLEDFKKQNEQYKAHILFVGGFSAGKSALLNKYIGKNVLKEGQAPETDIATELHFSEKERIVANLLDGGTRVIDSTVLVDIEKVRNLEYYLNSERIKTQCDYIIVDTPGFDSGIEKHNRALMQYVDYGTAFILVVDCEKGTISESALNFVNEVSNYSGDVAVIINKCDKKIPEEVIEVQEYIEDLLLSSCGRSFPVICTSIYDSDVADKLLELISGFQPEYLYEKNITSVLNHKRENFASALELIKEKETCDTESLDEEIRIRENAKKT